MSQIQLLSWNVNGIRAIEKKGFLDWLYNATPDILCLQETKVNPDILKTPVRHPDNYHTWWNYSREKKGYAGVATFSRSEPVQVKSVLGIPRFDIEGRMLITEFPEFTLFNVYFPNGKKDEERLNYKLDFYDAFLEYIEALKNQGKNLVICGDYNTAYREIDLARPKENQNVSGFLPVERAWIGKLEALGYIDTFRQFHPEPEQYTWWDMKSRARERNVGWRIDYVFITSSLMDNLKDAYILPEVMGSDHCPVGITLEFS